MKGVRFAASSYAVVRANWASAESVTVRWLPWVTVPGGKPVTEVPGLTPRSPEMIELPVLVTVVPASTAKDVAFPNSTDGWAAAWALTATATSSASPATDAVARLTRRDTFLEFFIVRPFECWSCSLERQAGRSGSREVRHVTLGACVARNTSERSFHRRQLDPAVRCSVAVRRAGHRAQSDRAVTDGSRHGAAAGCDVHKDSGVEPPSSQWCCHNCCGGQSTAARTGMLEQCAATPAESLVLEVVPRVDRALAGRLDLRLRGGLVDPVGALDGLAGLQILVDLEEVLDLEPVELRHVVDVLAPGRALVAGGHAEHLVVAARLVAHPEHAERTAADQATGEGRLLEQHQGVQRVAVLAKGALDEAVVVRVAGGGEEHPVQADPPGRVVELVLVPLTLGDLDGDVELHGSPSRASGNSPRAAPQKSVHGRAGH